MAIESKIEWTRSTFNPWHGCTKVSPGCDHCYAERDAHRFGTAWGPDAERRTFGDKHWNEPRRWNEKARKEQEADPTAQWRVFCASMGDVFDNAVPQEHRDRLWVREAWGVSPIYDSVSPRDLKPRDMKVNFAADDALRGCRVRPSIHMLRWASRILLEVVSVRVERLQDISEADAWAEGVQCVSHIDYRSAKTEDGKELHSHAVDLYRDLWESINGPGSWGDNPWVWVVEFKRVEQ